MTWRRNFDTSDQIPRYVDPTRRKKKKRKGPRIPEEDKNVEPATEGGGGQEITKEDTTWFTPNKQDVYPTGARRRVHSPVRRKFDLQDIVQVVAMLVELAEEILESPDSG